MNLLSTVQPDICLQADEIMDLLPDDTVPLPTTPGRVSGVPCLLPAQPAGCVLQHPGWSR